MKVIKMKVIKMKVILKIVPFIAIIALNIFAEAGRFKLELIRPFALIVGVSLMTWDDSSVIWGKMFAGITAAVMCSWFMLTKEERQYIYVGTYKLVKKKLF